MISLSSMGDRQTCGRGGGQRNLKARNPRNQTEHVRQCDERRKKIAKGRRGEEGGQHARLVVADVHKMREVAINSAGESSSSRPSRGGLGGGGGG